MIFGDTSGLVPLIVDDPLSARARRLAHSGGAMVVWWATATEAPSVADQGQGPWLPVAPSGILPRWTTRLRSLRR